MDLNDKIISCICQLFYHIKKPHSRYKQLHGNYVGIFIYLICDLLLMIFNTYANYRSHLVFFLDKSIIFEIIKILKNKENISFS